jgi:hypothetical protein
MVDSFSFTDGGRTYSCRTETRRGAVPETWWWFDVSGDVHRYAPFQAADSDTQAAVKARIVAYYVDLLDRRSRPAEHGHHWTNRNKGQAGSQT